MSEDTSLIALVALVWGALAAAYAFVPMFQMPGSAQVWGAGALVFAALTVALLRAERSWRRRR